MNEKIIEGLNTGVLVGDPRETDFIAGAASGLIVPMRLTNGDWEEYLPATEKQSSVYMDTMACVTFSALNVIETQVNYMIRNGDIPPDAVAKLRALGFFDKDDKFNCSDRFTAKMSGTTRSGNYLALVWDSIRNDGLLPEADWSYPVDQRTPTFDWDDYYKTIPQELKDKAKEIKKILDIKNEWLQTGGSASQTQLKEWLKSGPVQIATAICSPWSTKEPIKACGLGVSHATMVRSVGDTTRIFDQYDPFNKQLDSGYLIPYVMRGIVYYRDSVPVDLVFAKKYAGQLILAVDDRGALWYVTKNGSRAKIGQSSEDVAMFLKQVNEKRVPVIGMKDADLKKIPMA